MRELLDEEKPDAIFFVTDPRFYGFLFNMSDEIRDRGIPLLYWAIWDEKPAPLFNKSFYNSCDFVGGISKLTHEVLNEIGHPNLGYIPHALDYEVFKPFDLKERTTKKAEGLKNHEDKFVFFYNSRNARRKMTSDVIRFFKKTLDVVGQDKAFMLMHTDPNDQEGANLVEVVKMLGLTPDQIAFSNARVPPEEMATLYNIVDCTVCLSNNEGFGLSSLESLACGTPVISVRTGGLQDQNINDDTGVVYGVSIEPKTKSLTGSQQIPYIYDCRCTDEDILNAYLHMFNMNEEDRNQLGLDASEYVRKRFPMTGPNGMITKWDKAFTEQITKYRKNGNPNRIKSTKI